jgi:diaminopimelate decarboxylase
LGKRANVSLRLVPEIESGTHSGLQTAFTDVKIRNDAGRGLFRLSQLQRYAASRSAGIHLHIGSQIPTPEFIPRRWKYFFASLLRIHNENRD